MSPWLDCRFSPKIIQQADQTIDRDWLTFIDLKQANHDGVHQDSVSLFEHELRNRFNGLRMFHFTRLSDLEQVRQMGLRAWTAEDLRRRAHDRLKTFASWKDIESAINRVIWARQCGFVYGYASIEQAINGDHRNGELPHFARMQGEFDRSIAIELGLDPDLAETPDARSYVLVCDIPWDQLQWEDIRWVAESALLATIEARMVGGTSNSRQRALGCISHCGDIPPNCITLVADIGEFLGRHGLTQQDFVWNHFSPAS